MIINGNECLNAKRQPVLKFSAGFIKQVEALKQRNYELKQAKVNFIVYWTDANTKQELKVILPELLFQRTILE
jgi:ATP-dependent DNA helicase RecQ